ncbi:quaternary amine ABC transporter ATP-binding protein [Amorphus orientalis]|uniref:Quaternary amine transport ATP-binding protein n=1 Tax=Amorphus orientalis TaxID=649198 RepID=A0AAE3VL48_9HYPH|nr:glycine betaine/L-proline ABC transporter ATP-binding protein [Amorphus orientalis]MDQ0314056.1 glycine betaine/proline transport system ATP-binding protein [Amorphus orientalis]
MALIEVEHITKIFGPNPKQALARVRQGLGKDALLAETGHTLGIDDVSLSIERGQIFVIMGLSGSGKSTLIRHFNRLIDPTDGTILVDGKDVMALGNRELEDFRRRRMSMVFQRFGLMPHRTVLQNVAYGLEVRGLGRAERQRQAKEWVEAVGLSGFENQFPSQLSGGMQQRVGLARALATDADILLMDEAFSALDPLIRSQMQDQLVALQARLGKTIVFITHDLDEALKIGDRIAILKDGQLSQVGRPAEILLSPADDYVRAFVRDVNRARVLTVDVVMKPPQHRITEENLERALADMRRMGADYGYAVDGDSYRGIVTQDAVKAAIDEPNGARTTWDVAQGHPVLNQTDPLEVALPTTLEAAYPVAVVDEAGHLRGVVSSANMSDVLAPPEDDVPPEPVAPGGTAGSAAMRTG